ncbi:MAG TPA: preQ(1) synthase [Candidatus Latescibacteria bacterium]|nr:preQ(1) synthase [Candidatus Latescibacterota bacterium]HPC45315.1 preQ(1) synthase [Candidatus Latescibacterota bacterium]HQK22074.1 preQ(1) synthase [Candidatus Latescibacterota bacterium]HRS96145.1 preQ(1) synthase [Candidatus Latescibacterota bacterium]
MTTTTGYDENHAKSQGETPAIDVWPNQYRDRSYTIRITIPEFTSMCPKTGQPDFATITIVYEPDALCVELKSLKLYMQAYRNMGIFFENVANKILNEFVAACKPRRAVVVADFNPRGGIRTSVRVSYSNKSN